MNTTSYSLAMTPEGRLIVQGQAVHPPAGMDPDDSEALLAWALEQVTRAHHRGGGTMNVTLRDQRPTGYGAVDATLQPGQVISLTHLVELRAPRNTPAAAQDRPDTQRPTPLLEASNNDDTPVVADDDLDDKPRSVAAAFAPTEAEIAAKRARAEAALRREVEEEEDRKRRIAEEAGRERARREEQAKRDREESEARVRAEIESIRARHSKKDIEAALAAPEGLVPDATPRRRGRFGLPKGAPKGPQKAPRPNKKEAARDSLREAVLEENKRTQTKAANQYGWTEFEPTFPRPHVEPRAVRATKRVPWYVMALGALLALAALLGFYAQSQKAQYAAICVDDRSLIRVAERNCEDHSTPDYHRWMFMPEGSTVPAVSRSAQKDQGSFDKPDMQNATVDREFPADGGVVGE